jgi:hypothetical protein
LIVQAIPLFTGLYSLKHISSKMIVESDLEPLWFVSFCCPLDGGLVYFVPQCGATLLFIDLLQLQYGY